MAVTNNLKVQVDTPVWEWCRVTPGGATLTSNLSCTCATDNSLFHVQHGRYIYFLLTTATFYRYDTVSDSYMLLNPPMIAQIANWSSMSFAGASGYYSRVIAAPSSTTIQAALLSGNIFKGFDIRIIGGTGAGQQRTITSVADSVIADYGAASGAALNSVSDTKKNWLPNQWVGYQVKLTLFTGAVQTRKIIYNTATSLVWADNTKFAEDVWCNGNIIANSPIALPVAGTNYQIESSVLTVDSAFTTPPDATSRFVIASGGIWLASNAATSMLSLQYYDIAADTWYVRSACSGPIITQGTDGTIQGFGENCSVWDRGTASSGTLVTLVDNTKGWTVNQWSGYYVRIISGLGVGQLRLITTVTGGTTGKSDYTTLNWASLPSDIAPDATSRYSIEGFDAGTVSSVTVCSNTATGTSSTIDANIMTIGSATNAFKPGMILSAASGMPGFIVLSSTVSGAASQAVVTCASTAGIFVGMVVNIVTGTGALGTGVNTVISVTDSTHFVLSQNIVTILQANVVVLILSQGLGYTSAASAACLINTNAVVVTDTAGLIPGMPIEVTSGIGAFPHGTTVLAVQDKTHFTTSANATSALTSVGLSQISAYNLITTYIVNQLTGPAGDAGTYTIFPAQTVASTTITGKGIASLVDSSKSWTASRWNNQMVRITGGPGAGQTRSIVGTTSTTLILGRDWTVSPTSSSTYVIHGDTDKILISTGLASPGNSAVYIQNCEIDVLTTGRALDWGAARGLSAQLLVTGQTYGDTMAIHCATAVYSAASGSFAITSGSSTATTITMGYSGAAFLVGSFITVSGASPAGYNNAANAPFRVLSSAANTVTVNSTANPGAWSSGGTIVQAASLLVTTTVAHNFMTGQTIAFKGDYGVAASMAVNNANFSNIFVNSSTTFTVGLTSASASATIQAQTSNIVASAIPRLVDVTKNWVVNRWAGCLATFTTVGAPNVTSGLVATTTIEIAANDTNCLYFKGTAAATPVVYASRYVITPPAYSTLKNMIGVIDGGLSVQIGSAVGSADSASIMVDNYKMWSSSATCCGSSGTNVITISGTSCTTVGLQVGMYVAVWAGTGAFTFAAAAQVYTSVQVTAVTSSSTFTVSAIPAVALSSATVQATFWPENRFTKRQLRIIGGTGLNQDVLIASNTGNIITATTTTAPVTGASTYAILQTPGKGTGISMMWNFGTSDATKRGRYVYLPRGNATMGIDRLDLQTDQWEYVEASPNFEALSTGSMYAYDGVDRMYFTVNATQRIYYLDLDKGIIHAAGTWPFINGTAHVGNRMEIYETVDGLKFLWLSNHARTEVFKTLLYF